jgi:hypothetical protein
VFRRNRIVAGRIHISSVVAMKPGLLEDSATTTGCLNDDGLSTCTTQPCKQPLIPTRDLIISA